MSIIDALKLILLVLVVIVVPVVMSILGFAIGPKIGKKRFIFGLIETIFGLASIAGTYFIFFVIALTVGIGAGVGGKKLDFRGLDTILLLLPLIWTILAFVSIFARARALIIIRWVLYAAFIACFFVLTQINFVVDGSGSSSSSATTSALALFLI